MKKKRILIACEYSGVVREAFAARGWDAWSCDLLETETPGQHYVGDVRDILADGWDIVIAHPPCTFLCNSGVRWLFNPDGTRNEARWANMEEGARFFKTFLNLSGKCPVVVENPIMHKYAVEIIGCRQSQVIQPWMFGHGETKATGLWIKYLPPLKPECIVPGREQRVWRMPPSPERWKERSRTYPGIAAAMAKQWSIF
jgi:hypothetical protein